ncbi:N-acetylmuramoyl-L-alanine amidase [Pedobacter sp. HMWF019]|uniref:N-acetylmuramoyl-L-alanine amidase n=1 Tax=Pedobacter sp. HMWF019 TaxID=2056856 RepID=UPI001304F10F|nr:N-acetylmuramoyl-L-alanine amidase [Pedobacter sp. HMWF019]
MILPERSTTSIGIPDNFRAVPVNKTSFDWMLTVQVLYWGISGLLMLKLLYAIVVILLKTLKKGKKNGSFWYIYDHFNSNASFFNMIFLNPEGAEEERIVVHEQLHCRLLHSIDHLLLDVVAAFTWFNPIIYFLKRDLYQIHEYQVDHFLIQKYDPKDYAELLLRSASFESRKILNTFHTPSVLYRVQMMFKERSDGKLRMVYFLIIFPLTMVILYFNTSGRAYGSNAGRGFVLVIDAAHGGKDAGGISINGVQEKDIVLQVAYKLRDEARKRGISTVMTRGTDEFMTLKDRTALQGNFFISLHMNAGTSGKSSKGLELIYSAENMQAETSHQIALSLQEKLRKLQGMQVSDEVMNSNLYVLRKSRSPAVAIEMGDANFSPDLKFILNQEKQQELAGKIMDAITSF